MIMREYTYIVVDWASTDYFQVETPTDNYYVYAKDSCEALRKVLRLEGVISYASFNQVSSERIVEGGYVACYYKVVY